MEKEMKGILFDIQRFCISDGPGIRTVLFFKGCPLRCKWCHNPESWEKEPQLIYRNHKCAGCAQCVGICPYGAHSFEHGGHEMDFTKCRKCAKCVDVCCYGAVEMLGKQVSIPEVIDLIRTDYPYYGADGGVAFSGGEPAMQPAFAEALARAIKDEGINLCVETCGFGDIAFYERVAPFVDLFLFDWKASDDKKHREFTGASNKPILKNLEYLNSEGKRIVLRCPMIPGVNDTDNDLQTIAGLYNKYDMIESVELLPYHAMGESKKIQTGKIEELYPIRSPTAAEKEQWICTLQALACPARLG